jgi:CRP/FNR family transcriptional regulator, cyclic AMP receptor protein
MRLFPVKLESLIEDLKNTFIFQSLTDDELKKLAPLCEHYEYEKDDIIVTQDSVSRFLYVLLSGTIAVTVRGKERENIFMSSLHKGDVFGEASIFMDVRRTANTVAAENLRLVAISRDKLFELCNDDPRVGLKIFTFIIYSLLRKLSLANRDLAMERESMVTKEDLDRLKDMFPKTIDEILRR